MRKAVLYIAMSLDGYIADSSGKVDWLIIMFDLPIKKFIMLVLAIIRNGGDNL